MRLNAKPIIVSIFFIAFFSYYALADDGSTLGRNGPGEGTFVISGYSTDQAPVPGYPETASGMDVSYSFWELPLWVQFTYLTIVGATALGLLKLMPFAFGRLKHALENPKTKDIFVHIQDNPGLTIKQLSQEQNINRGTLKYHLSQLFTNNKIMLVRRGKVSQLYHNKLAPMDKESVIASYLRKEDKSQSILFTIMDNPGVTNKDLSERFEMDKSTITDYMKKFMDDGLVEFRQDGKFKRCYLLQDARMIILRYRPQ
jgi:predicted transcriptional regulator